MIHASIRRDNVFETAAESTRPGAGDLAAVREKKLADIPRRQRPIFCRRTGRGGKP